LGFFVYLFLSKKNTIFVKSKIMGAKKLSELQLELLKVYSFNPSNEDLVNIKTMLAKYFANKLTSNVQKAMDGNNITNDDLENWLNEKS